MHVRGASYSGGDTINKIKQITEYLQLFNFADLSFPNEIEARFPLWAQRY